MGQALFKHHKYKHFYLKCLLVENVKKKTNKIDNKILTTITNRGSHTLKANKIYFDHIKLQNQLHVNAAITK